MLKLKLNCWDQSDQVWFVMKTKQNNDMTDHTDAVYIKNEIELPWLIVPGLVYDEYQIGQRYDQSYRFSLCQNWN